MLSLSLAALVLASAMSGCARQAQPQIPDTVDGLSEEKPEEPEKKKVELGKPVEEASDDAAPAAQVNAANAVKAPLPGTITSIEVAVGQEVKAGDTVVVLEAMKMQNSIEAEKDGKVTAIAVKVGQAVLEDDPLVVVE